MSELPSVASMVDALEKVTGAEGIDAAAALSDSNVDSLDLLDWLYELEQGHDFEVSDEFFAGITTNQTIEQIHQKMTEWSSR